MSDADLSLRITRPALDRVFDWAAEAGRLECIGLGAGRKKNIIERVCLLPSVATGGSAVVAPLTVREAVHYFRSANLRVSLLWHSHGMHSCFHSGTDDAQTERMFPALAEALFERSPPPYPQPTVCGPDAALLPLPDGCYLKIMVAGPPVTGTLSLPAAWSRIITRCTGPEENPRIVLLHDRAILAGGGMTLLLFHGPGTKLTTEVIDLAPLRRARLWSLVVNVRHEAYAQCVTVMEDDEGESRIRRRQCGVQVIDSGPGRQTYRTNGSARATEIPGFPLLAETNS